MRIYIGHDDREPMATRGAVRSLQRVADIQPEVLRVQKLQSQGLLTRTFDYRSGCDYDLVSNASQSTRFAISRFLVPIICQRQWALFVDSDVVFIRDPFEILSGIDDSKAVYVVKHDTGLFYDGEKMAGQRQEVYSRKGWSSVMLFNCKHPANERLSLRDINERPGRDLHAFYWLADDEIGELSPVWNWLVDMQPPPENVGIAHFTLGGPFTPGWPGAPSDELWYERAGVKVLAGGSHP